MEDREKLVELLKQKSCAYVPCDGECGECRNVEMYDDAIESIAVHLIAHGITVGDKQGSTADNLSANGVTVQEWIPASEPPKCIGLYLVALLIQFGGEMASREAFWDGTNWRCSYNNRIISRRVTHWTEIPKPPKGERNG